MKRRNLGVLNDADSTLGSILQQGMVKLRAYLSVVFSTVAITGAQSELTTFQVTSEESNIAKSVSMPSSVLRTDVQEQ